MKLSVIVPIYNAEKFLNQCIESLVNQTYKNFEIVLVNDGSKDNSLAICESYAKNDKRIKIISQENKGISGAVITGIENSTGEYISFVDADDFCELNKYEKLMQKATEFDCDMVACGIKSDTGFVRISKAKEGLYADKNIKKLYKNIFLFGGYCTRYNKVIKRTLLIDNLDIYKMCKHSINEDYYFYLSFFFDLKRVYILHDVLCDVRVAENTNSTTKTQRKANFETPNSFYEDMKKIFALKGKDKYLKQIYNFIFQAYKAQLVIVKRNPEYNKKVEIKKIVNDKLFRKACWHTSWKFYPNYKSHLKDYVLQILVILRFNWLIVKV